MNENFLQGIGKIWSKQDYSPTIVLDESCKGIVRKVLKTLNQKQSKSVVLTGEHGVGKSTITDAVCLELHRQNWTIFVASASEIMAGQKYIGELEQQVKNVIYELKQGKNTLWVIPDFHETYYVGRTNLNPLGIMDQIIPAITTGEILVLGESQSSHYEKVIQKKPVLRNTLQQLMLDPLNVQQSDELAFLWAQNHPNKKLWGNVKPSLINDVGELARQYLPTQEEPGLLFDFLKATNAYLDGNAPAGGVTYAHFITTLSQITGFPEELLDDQQRLALDELEKAFNERIIGQPEAVKHIIERIAMVKAGLTDPQRPLGVFLFVGPTGTGKTEVAKTLVNYLFGAEDRMIRLDMSEFQTADDLIRITGGYSPNNEVESLVSQVRKQPFSVVLLDEFEKSHQRIWDLFLQVFDDGRLTDDQGSVVDFRNTIIILTSNTGASDKLPPRIGFGENEDAITTLNNSIIKSLQQTFRMEFLNRIDRIICFNPLGANTIRKILKIELKKVLQRRGFRQRRWEVEWDESAINLLMEHGYDPEMGARPMKRAIEELLLAPLAITIVNHNFPKGDQFLFVREHQGKLKVDFVDPETPHIDWKQQAKKAESEQKKAENLTLEQIILDPKGKLREKEVIRKEWEILTELLKQKDLEKIKEELMLQMAVPEFWSDPERFEVMSDVEFIDRFMHSYSNLQSLMERISDTEKLRLEYPAELLQRIANRLRLLKQAINAYVDNEYQECFLTLEANEEDKSKPTMLEHFENQLRIYQRWAQNRRMTIRYILKDTEQQFRVQMLVTGFAARQLLAKESGLHVWETASKKQVYKDQKSKTIRHRIQVISVPCPKPSDDIAELKKILKEQVKDEIPTEMKLVRTYKTTSTPMIKDHLSSWQTTKIDQVLGGNWDLM